MSFILLYGRPGTGKTTLACSMTKLGYKIKLVDVDDKATDMLSIRPLVESGQIEIFPIKAKSFEGSLRNRILVPRTARVKQPLGYLQFCDIISEFEKLEPRLQMDTVLVAPDSLTALQLHLEKLILHLNPPAPPKKPGAYDPQKFEFDQWEALRSNYHDLFSSLRNLQSVFRHVIVISHELSVMDEETKEVSAILPNIRGSMRNDYGQYFNEVYHLEKPRLRGRELQYIVLTKAVDLADARTSRNLQTIEEADFAVLFKEELQSKESST